MTSEDIAVIGAGIVGVQLARALQREGFRVTLIDRQGPGEGTSFGNAGFIATDEILPLAHGRILRSLPKILSDPLGPISVNWRQSLALVPWLTKYLSACSGAAGERGIAALASLQIRAADAWLEVIREEHLDDLVKKAGAYKLFETDGGLEATHFEREMQTRHGIEWRALDARELREEIVEVAGAIKHAVFYPDGMHVVSPHAVTARLFEHFIEAGGKFVCDTIRGIVPMEGSVTLNGSDRIRTVSKVAVCAGFESGALTKTLGLPVPLVAERGYHVEVSHDEISFDCPLGFYERGFYATPMTSGLRLAGTTEFVTANATTPPNWDRADLLKRHIDDLLPEVAKEETHRWIGARPTLPDFLPVLDRAPNSSRVFF
ncbi:MAG: FAD-dependent oxidoreductase, partial [Pseudomonadota bacterium]